MYRIIHYKTGNNIDIFDKWFDRQRDHKAMARILARIEHMRDGSFGDCKPIESGLWEARIDIGQGYRLYYSIIEKEVVLILCGGNKSSQKRDISKAIEYLEDHKRRIKNGEKNG